MTLHKYVWLLPNPAKGTFTPNELEKYVKNGKC